MALACGARGASATRRATPTRLLTLLRLVGLGRLRSGRDDGTTECAFPRCDLVQHRMRCAAEPGDRRLHSRLAGEAANVGHLLVDHQRHHRAVRAGAGSPPRTVQVRLVFHGRIGVNDESHVVDVDAARGDVRGDQHPGRTIREGREVAGTGVLGQVAVQLDRRHASRIQLTGKILGAVLRARKDDLPPWRRGKVGQNADPCRLVDMQHVMVHGGHRRLRRIDAVLRPGRVR